MRALGRSPQVDVQHRTEQFEIKTQSYRQGKEYPTPG